MYYVLCMHVCTMCACIMHVQYRQVPTPKPVGHSFGRPPSWEIPSETTDTISTCKARNLPFGICVHEYMACDLKALDEKSLHCPGRTPTPKWSAASTSYARYTSYIQDCTVQYRTGLRTANMRRKTLSSWVPTKDFREEHVTFLRWILTVIFSSFGLTFFADAVVAC